ncbi:MAG: hypothetical protein KC535_05875 [Nanoarchaeota archaeon]|nr:hypothetical protein [Nanoarchaeota archaeon]
MKIESIENGVRSGFSKIKDELNEHLDAINQNTAELTTAYQYIAQLESRIEKLNERIDELTLTVQGSVATPSYSIDLSLREQEVFLSLYMSAEPLCVEEMAKQLGLTSELVGVSLNKLVSKGVPLIRKTVNELTFFSLESSFKSMQARKNVVPVSESVAAQFN